MQLFPVPPSGVLVSCAAEPEPSLLCLVHLQAPHHPQPAQPAQASARSPATHNSSQAAAVPGPWVAAAVLALLLAAAWLGRHSPGLLLQLRGLLAL